jgi:hypothetical protein
MVCEICCSRRPAAASAEEARFVPDDRQDTSSRCRLSAKKRHRVPRARENKIDKVSAVLRYGGVSTDEQIGAAQG